MQKGGARQGARRKDEKEMKQIPKLVVLLGKPNSGKTATMHRVVDKLVSDDKQWIKRSKRTSDDRSDFTVQFTYHGKKVYLASRGDDKPPMERNVRAIIAHKCEIAVVVVSMPSREGARKAVYEYYREEMVAMVSCLKEVKKEHLENPSKKEIEDSIRRATEEVVAAIDSLL